MMQGIIGWLEQHAAPCTFKLQYGIECLGCGFQRSLALLLRGEIFDSLIMYPALLPILSLVGYFFVHVAVQFRHAAIVVKLHLFAIAILMLFRFLHHLL